MPDITKTAGVTLLDWTQVAANATGEGGAVDVDGVLCAGIIVELIRQTGSALTGGTPAIRIEGSVHASGNGHWGPIVDDLAPPVGASIANTTLSAAVNAGDASVTVASATNIAAGDLLGLGDTSTENYEIVRVKSVSGTTITLENHTTKAHASGAQVTDQAERWLVPNVDLRGIRRVRVVCERPSQAVAVFAAMCTGDAIE